MVKNSNSNSSEKQKQKKVTKLRENSLKIFFYKNFLRTVQDQTYVNAIKLNSTRYFGK